MTAPSAFLASLVAAGPSAHEGGSFTAFATLPLSRLPLFQRSFGIDVADPRDAAALDPPVFEPPVVLLTARWPRAGESDEAVIAEAAAAFLERCAAGDAPGLSPAMLGRLAAILVRIRTGSPSQPAPENQA